MSYVDEVLEVVKKKNADQPEFLQAVTCLLYTSIIVISIPPVKKALDYVKRMANSR